MANAREIQSRIKSIKDTMKITNAMYMISTTKLRRARERLEKVEPYFYTLGSTMTRILRHMPDIEHIYFKETDKIPESEKKIGYIVITADKGMAGAYNHNVIKKAEELMNATPNGKLYVVGQIGSHYFEKKGIPVSTHFHYTAQNPSLSRARNISERIINRYKEGRLDEVYVIYTRMVSAVSVETEVQKLLPLQKQDFKMSGVKIPISERNEEISLYPSPESVVNAIGQNYVTGFIYGALVESFASEQNSRVMAMEAATNSAKDMLKELQIVYNRARQAAITQEITEVIGGAKAQKSKKKR